MNDFFELQDTNLWMKPEEKLIKMPILTYDEVSEIVNYNGFPVRYPSWEWQFTTEIKLPKYRSIDAEWQEYNEN